MIHVAMIHINAHAVAKRIVLARDMTIAKLQLWQTQRLYPLYLTLSESLVVRAPHNPLHRDDWLCSFVITWSSPRITLLR